MAGAAGELSVVHCQRPVSRAPLCSLLMLVCKVLSNRLGGGAGTRRYYQRWVAVRRLGQSEERHDHHVRASTPHISVPIFRIKRTLIRSYDYVSPCFPPEWDFFNYWCNLVHRQYENQVSRLQANVPSVLQL